MYSCIPSAPDAVPDRLRVPAVELRRHLELLRAEGYLLVGLTEALAVAAARPYRRIAALTFDGAYADLRNAVEILGGLRARATLYVPVDRVQERPAAVAVDAGARLSWSQLAELPPGWEIGSHSSSHVPLDLLDGTALAYELQGSRRRLREHLGVEVASFCYPHGYSSRRVRRAVAAAGYLNACGMGRRLARPDGDPYAVERVQPVPGMSDRALVDLVTGGDARLAPVAERVTAPAWRLTRRAARLAGRNLT
jgi:peptidoglycan/xylan/chitin deacetylase (PgdA/CDA1 family)